MAGPWWTMTFDTMSSAVAHRSTDDWLLLRQLNSPTRPTDAVQRSAVNAATRVKTVGQDGGQDSSKMPAHANAEKPLKSAAHRAEINSIRDQQTMT
jgi:hypothetical protein